jgi:hypothetical protein
LRLVPQKTILILEQDDISRRGSARLAARFLQEHKGEKSDRFAVSASTFLGVSVAIQTLVDFLV